jgi:hypothetical protein
MPAEQLQLRTDDPVFGQVGDKLMTEEMEVDSLLDARGTCVLRDQLA